LEQRHLRRVDHVGVDRVEGERGVVEGALPELRVVTDAPPAVAAVVGAVEATLLGLDEGEDALGLGGRGGRAGLAIGARGGAAAGRVGVLLLGVGLGDRPELLPGVAAVTGDVEPAAGAAAGQRPRFPPRLPEAGEDDLGVGGVEADVRGAGVLVLVQYLHKDEDTGASDVRSEEHTSELQSLTNLVCRLLLEKKKQNEHRNATLDDYTARCN